MSNYVCPPRYLHRPEFGRRSDSSRNTWFSGCNLAPNKNENITTQSKQSQASQPTSNARRFVDRRRRHHRLQYSLKSFFHSLRLPFLVPFSEEEEANLSPESQRFDFLHFAARPPAAAARSKPKPLPTCYYTTTYYDPPPPTRNGHT